MSSDYLRFRAWVKYVLSAPNLKRKYVHDIIEAMVEYPTFKAPRQTIIDRVREIRNARGEIEPRKFEDTVQGSFEGYCGESDNFKREQKNNLFCWPEGKYKGIWGLNVAAVEAFVREIKWRHWGLSLDEL